MELKKRKATKAKAKAEKPLGKYKGKQLYKVLKIDGNPNQTYNSNFKYDLPVNGKPGKWKDHRGSLDMCVEGLHLTTNPANWLHPSVETERVFEAEYRGRMVTDNFSTRSDKICCQSVRLTREVAVIRRGGGRFSVRRFTAAEKKAHDLKIASVDKLEKLATKAQRLKDQISVLRKKASDRNWAERNQATRALGLKYEQKGRTIDAKAATKQKQIDLKYNAIAQKLGAKNIDSDIVLHLRPAKKPKK